jgi:hypothetical protein
MNKKSTYFLTANVMNLTGTISFPCAAWERGVDASHPEPLGVIAPLTHALWAKNGLRRRPEWVPMRRMGTRTLLKLMTLS